MNKMYEEKIKHWLYSNNISF